MDSPEQPNSSGIGSTNVESAAPSRHDKPSSSKDAHEAGKQSHRTFRLTFIRRSAADPQQAASSEETLKLGDTPPTKRHLLASQRESATPSAFIRMPCCLICLLLIAIMILLFLLTGYHVGKYLHSNNGTEVDIDSEDIGGLVKEQRMQISSVYRPLKSESDKTKSNFLEETVSQQNQREYVQPIAMAHQQLAQQETIHLGHMKRINHSFGADLLKAAKHGKVDVVRALLGTGVDPNVLRNAFGNTALHLAATYGHLDTVRLLLDNGADVGARNSKQQTPLYYAACEGKEKVVALLVHYGADVNELGKDGNTPLHCAAEEGWEQVEQILLEHGANVNVKNRHGFTPLHWAAQFGKLKACSTLLANGADPTAKVAANGFSPLHLAAQEGHKHILELLLDHGASVEDKDNYGWTGNIFIFQLNNEFPPFALHHAIRNERLGCVRVLLNRWKSDLGVKDNADLFTIIHQTNNQAMKELVMYKALRFSRFRF